MLNVNIAIVLEIHAAARGGNAQKQKSKNFTNPRSCAKIKFPRRNL